MTSSSYLAAFNFRAAPFSKEVDDDDLWLPESKQSLVESVEDAVAEKQSVILLGEPGVGKTCVLRALRRRVPEAGYRLSEPMPSGVEHPFSFLSLLMLPICSPSRCLRALSTARRPRLPRRRRSVLRADAFGR